MKKVVFSGILFLSAFIGIMILVGIFAIYSGSYDYINSRFIGYLKDSGTTIPFIICIVLCLIGGFTSLTATYSNE